MRRTQQLDEGSMPRRGDSNEDRDETNARLSRLRRMKGEERRRRIRKRESGQKCMKEGRKEVDEG